MTAPPKIRRSRKVADSYLKLILEFPLVSIKSKDQFKAAQAMIDRLITSRKLNQGEEMYLDALGDLVAAYEDVHFPIPPASDADMLRHLMDVKGLSQAQLNRLTGISKSTISEVLAGKKSFSKSMIRTLAACFKVHPSVLACNL